MSDSNWGSWRKRRDNSMVSVYWYDLRNRIEVNKFGVDTKRKRETSGIPFSFMCDWFTTRTILKTLKFSLHSIRTLIRRDKIPWDNYLIGLSLPMVEKHTHLNTLQYQAGRWVEKRVDRGTFRLGYFMTLIIKCSVHVSRTNQDGD